MISMQFKTWLRLHEDKNMSSLPEELKPEEIAQQHFKSFLGDSLEIHEANKKKKKSDATLSSSSSSGKHVPIDVEIKHSLIRYLKDGITPRSADFRINHRITDIIRGSSGGGKKDLTTQDLALMLKKKEGVKRTLSDPSMEVFDHIKKNTGLKHDELQKKFKNVADFDDHYSDPVNLKNYRKLIKHWWKTGRNGKPLSIDPHSHVIVVYPKGHIIRTNKKHTNEKNFNEILSEHGLGEISERQKEQVYGGFEAEFRSEEKGGGLKTSSTRWSIGNPNHLGGKNEPDKEKRKEKGKKRLKVIKLTRQKNHDGQIEKIKTIGLLAKQKLSKFNPRKK